MSNYILAQLAAFLVFATTMGALLDVLVYSWARIMGRFDR